VAVEHVTNLRHECEKDGCYRAELWDWTPFNDCFGDSGIRISDIDGIVERNGLFLMLDGKRVGRRGERAISNGQRRLYTQFANKGGHVLVFHGQPPITVQWLRQWLPGGEFIQERACDLAGMRTVVAEWYVWANGMRAATTAPIAQLPVSLDDCEWPEVAPLGCGMSAPEYPGGA
jgi:hypothetical protein